MADGSFDQSDDERRSLGAYDDFMSTAKTTGGTKSKVNVDDIIKHSMAQDRLAATPSTKSQLGYIQPQPQYISTLGRAGQQHTSPWVSYQPANPNATGNFIYPQGTFPNPFFPEASLSSEPGQTLPSIPTLAVAAESSGERTTYEPLLAARLTAIEQQLGEIHRFIRTHPHGHEECVCDCHGHPHNFDNSRDFGIGAAKVRCTSRARQTRLETTTSQAVMSKTPFHAKYLHQSFRRSHPPFMGRGGRTRLGHVANNVVHPHWAFWRVQMERNHKREVYRYQS